MKRGKVSRQEGVYSSYDSTGVKFSRAGDVLFNMTSRLPKQSGATVQNIAVYCSLVQDDTLVLRLCLLNLDMGKYCTSKFYLITYHGHTFIGIGLQCHSWWGRKCRMSHDVHDILNAQIPTHTHIRNAAKLSNFLDRETKQIDELVSKERQKIEFIKQYRQALISQDGHRKNRFKRGNLINPL